MPPHKATEQQKTIAGFAEWIETVPRWQLLDLLKTAHWKGQLKNTEIGRFFELHRRGVDMTAKPEGTEAASLRGRVRSLPSIAWPIG